MRVAGVGATGDRGDDHRAIWHQAVLVFYFARDTACCQLRGCNASVWIGWSCDIAYHGRQVEAQDTLVLRVVQAISPQTACPGIGFHQLDLFGITTGEFEVVDSLLINIEHPRRGAKLRCHVGDGGAITERQCCGTFSEEFKVRRHHFLVTQKFGQRQHDVCGSDAWLALTGQIDTNDIGQAHVRSAPQHYVFSLKTTDTDSKYTERVDVRCMAVSTYQRIGESHAVARLNYRRHFLEIDLVHYAVAGLNHVDIPEGFFSPVNKMKTVIVTAVFDSTVFCKRVLVETAVLNRKRVVDNQLGWYHGVDL